MKKNQLEEKDLLTGKLLSYSAAAGALFALGQEADAQVIYTDVDPDSTVIAPEVQSQAIFEIDMNNDGTTDVTIVHGNGDWYYSTGVSNWMSVRALNGSGGEIAVQSSYISVFETTYIMAKRFDANDVIGPDESFMTHSFSFELGLNGTYP